VVIGDLLSNSAVQAWAIASVLLGLKTMGAGVYTSSLRIRNHVYNAPEDYVMQGHEPPQEPDESIERARRIHQNDLEAGVPFGLIGFVYALTDPSTTALWICFGGFILARTLHSITYARALMPHRTIAFSIGFLILIWMAIASLVELIG
jgi:glutathione S-transferase